MEGICQLARSPRTAPCLDSHASPRQKLMMARRSIRAPQQAQGQRQLETGLKAAANSGKCAHRTQTAVTLAGWVTAPGAYRKATAGNTRPFEFTQQFRITWGARPERSLQPGGSGFGFGANTGRGLDKGTAANMARSACWCGVSTKGGEAAGGEVTESESSSPEPGGEGGADGGALSDATERDAIGLSSSLLVLLSSENSSLLSAEGPADDTGAGAGENAVGGGAGDDSSVLSSGRASDVVGAGARDDSSWLSSDIASNAAGAGVGGDVEVDVTCQVGHLHFPRES
eukprot:2969380-Pleurochrysis_carterae.AAC.1